MTRLAGAPESAAAAEHGGTCSKARDKKRSVSQPAHPGAGKAAGDSEKGYRILRQATLRDRVTLEGVGVHSGKPVRLVLHPADAGSGIWFLRTGLADGGREHLIAARHYAVGATKLCTVLRDESGASVATVEHLMAALAGLGIDNLTIEIDGPEMPILDGSSAPFVAAIDQVGIVEQASYRRFIKVLKPVRVEEGAGFAELRPADKGFKLDVEIDFDTPLIGRQRRITTLTPQVFRREIARARTFGFMRDVEMAWKNNFALGASLDNTVVIGEDRIVNPEGLRWADEFVRHKTLDAIGDLALSGAPLQGLYRSYRPGHTLNAKVLAKLMEDRTAYALVDERPVRESGHAGVVMTAPAFAPETN